MRETNMTVGKPWRLIVAFAVPLLLGNLFQQFYSMADAFLISRFLGVDPFAGVSSTSSLSHIIIGFASGMTAGFAIPLAQAYGAGDRPLVRRLYRQNLLVSLGVALLLTVGSLLLVDRLLVWIRVPAGLMGYARRYLVIILMGITGSMLFNYFANTLRSLGDSKSPVTYLTAASLANIALDILLIRFTPLGVAGAALATVLSQWLSVALCVRRIYRGGSVLTEARETFAFDGKLLRQSLGMGFPMAFQSSVISLGVLLIQSATNSMGTQAIAAYAASQQIDGIAVEPLRSLGFAMTTFVAQNYGAGAYGRIKQGMRQCVGITLGMSVALGLVMLFFGRAFAAIFVGWGQTEILSLSHQFLMVHGALYAVLALLFDWRYGLQGMGNTKVVVAGSLMELLMRAVSAFWLVPALGFFGACIETPLSWIGALLPVVIVWVRTVRRMDAEKGAIVDGQRNHRKGVGEHDNA